MSSATTAQLDECVALYFAANLKVRRWVREGNFDLASAAATQMLKSAAVLKPSAIGRCFERASIEILALIKAEKQRAHSGGQR